MDQVFAAMEGADWHIYQVLTKRSSLMRDYIAKRYAGRQAPAHIWLGVSVEDSAHTARIRHLQQINTAGRFISFESLLGRICDVDLTGIAWRLSGARVDRARARWRRLGPSSFGTSVRGMKWLSSSSNGVAFDQRAVDACLTEKSGARSLGGLFRSPLGRSWKFPLEAIWRKFQSSMSAANRPSAPCGWRGCS